MSTTGSRCRSALIRVVIVLALPAALLTLLPGTAGPGEGGREAGAGGVSRESTAARAGSKPRAPAAQADRGPVPARLVTEQFGFRSVLSPATGVFEVFHEEKRAVFVLGTREAYLGGEMRLLEGAVTAGDVGVLLPPGAVDLLIRHFLGRALIWEYEDGVFSVKGRGAAGAPEKAGRGAQPSKDARPEILAVVIDPGHGGKDPGGVGYKGIKEKDLVLSTGLEVQRELKKRLANKEIVLTREDDRFLTLEERSGVANGLEPEKNPVFVSIHANVSLQARTKGFESYYLSLDSYDETSREVASMENSVLSFEMENYGSYLKEIVNRIVDVQYRRESYSLAGYIQGGISGSLGKGESADRGVKSAFFYVLKAVKMPSVLVEMGFVTNQEEVQKLLDPDYRKRVARGIADGIAEFSEEFRSTEGFTKKTP